jgi:hypothetical protein
MRNRGWDQALYLEVREFILDAVWCQLASTLTPVAYRTVLSVRRGPEGGWLVLRVFGKLYTWGLLYSASLGRDMFRWEATPAHWADDDPPAPITPWYSAQRSTAPGHSRVAAAQAAVRDLLADRADLDGDVMAVYSRSYDNSDSASLRGPGWDALRFDGRRVSPLRPCLKGIVHPHHFDRYGACRCACSASHHVPLLEAWDF